MRSKNLQIYNPTASDVAVGEIVCPLRGTMAIQRCHQWQRSTTSDGRSCRCSTFNTYESGRRELCGRVVPDTESIPSTPAIEVAMATRPKVSKNCTRCGKPSPPPSKISNGLCGPCRRDVEELQDRGEAEKPPTVPRRMTVVAATRGATDARQALLPALAEGEIARLKREVRKWENECERLEWLARGVVEGKITPQELGRLLPARSRVTP
jgi:hypothetical protein